MFLINKEEFYVIYLKQFQGKIVIFETLEMEFVRFKFKTVEGKNEFLSEFEVIGKV